MQTVEKPQAISARDAGALGALAMAAFCYVASETLPVGLLSSIASGLGVSQSSIGLLVTGYAVTVAVATIPLAYATRRVSRRRLMIVLLASLAAGTLGSAVASDYGLLMVSRLVVALGQALFWAVVGPVVAAMFDKRIRGRVMSIVFSGASLGPMLGVPLGTWVGQRYGWRAAFVALALLALLAFGALILSMPDVAVERTHAATGTNPDARRYAIVVVVTALSMAGLFTSFTYTEVFLTDVTGFAAVTIGPLLFVRGIADFFGISAGGYASDRWQRGTIVGAVVIQAGALFGMYAVAEHRMATVVLLAVSGFALGTLNPALQNRVLEVAPGSTDLASAGNSVCFNVGISSGSLIGATVLTGAGARETTMVGGLLMVVALLVLLAEPLLTRAARPSGTPRASATSGRAN